jgi:hypothetical protein
MEERRVPGMQVAVVREEEIVTLEALGVANLEHRVPVTHHSIFSINSMAKAFTGVALMQLVEAGRLGLTVHDNVTLSGVSENMSLWPWTGVTDNPRTASAVSAITRAINAAGVHRCRWPGFL